MINLNETPEALLTAKDNDHFKLDGMMFTFRAGIFDYSLITRSGGLVERRVRGPKNKLTRCCLFTREEFVDMIRNKRYHIAA